MKPLRMHWRRLIVGLIAAICLLASLPLNTVDAQESSSQPAPALNLDETQRVGDPTLGYITLPQDFTQSRDEAEFKEWTNADGSLSVILRHFDGKKEAQDYPDASAIQKYIMDYAGYEIGKGNATFVYVTQATTAAEQKQGLALTSYIRLDKNGQQVPSQINYYVFPDADNKGVNLVLIRVDSYNQETSQNIVAPLINSWSHAE